MVVLVGVDGSEGSRSALRWASRFGESMDMRLVVVRAWEYPPTAVMPGGPTLKPQEEVDEIEAAEAARLLDEVLGDAAGSVDVVVERGSPDVAIWRAADDCDADLVVVGRRGLSAVAGRLLGSVSRRVVERASCPVAVVPDPLLDWNGPVLVGVDGSANAAAAVDWATKVALAQQAELVVVHAIALAPLELSLAAIETMDSKAEALVEEQSRPAVEAGLAVRKVVRTLDPRTLVQDTADAEDARVVVVGARGAGPIASLMLGSTATFLTERCGQPVVIVPAATP
jgi:nucleotide-binding universal stress UspA family protein